MSIRELFTWATCHSIGLLTVLHLAFLFSDLVKDGCLLAKFTCNRMATVVKGRTESRFFKPSRPHPSKSSSAVTSDPRWVTFQKHSSHRGGWLYTKLPLQQHRGSIWRSISYTDDPAMSWSLVEAKAAGRESLVKRSAFWRSDPLLFSFSSHIRSETHKRCQQGTKSKRKGWAASRHNNRCIKVNTCIRLKTSKTVSQEGADFFVIGALSFVFRDSSWVNVLRETQETSPVRDIC